METIEVRGVSNQGWSFTHKRLKQLYSLNQWINSQNRKEKFTYKSIQEKISDSKNEIDDSKLRMFFPFLRAIGMLNNYGGSFFSNKLYTDLGYEFMNLVIPLYLNKFFFPSEDREKIINIFQLYILMGYRFMISNDCPNQVYRYFPLILKEVGEMDKKDFFIMTECINKKVDITTTIKFLKEYKTKKVEIKEIKHKNSFGYIVPFFEEMGLIEKIDNKNYKLNISKFQIIEGELNNVR